MSGRDEAGPTGDFPHGKLNDTDEGGLRIAIGEEKGNVMIEFGKATAWIAMPPDRALAFAATIVRRAMMIKAGER
ncbi:MAG TPA: hypothetical protein VHT52_02020 [Stellaceae bacterium]|jgi:hypothetical protein|nr:hypothetical protein [Stellaceae bacterium]